jgi:hypothetical protein
MSTAIPLEVRALPRFVSGYRHKDHVRQLYLRAEKVVLFSLR